MNWPTDIIKVGVFQELCFGFIQIGLFWALMNLVPVYPLDGGQIARELFVLSGTSNGIVKSLKLSIASGVAVGLVGMKFDMMFIGIMFFMLAYSSYQLLQRMQGRYFWETTIASNLGCNV